MMQYHIPKTIEITEVGLRDGFQNIKKWIPTPVKIDLARRLMRAGIRSLEAASFVSPDRVPQMADAQEVYRAVAAEAPEGTALRVLALNAEGVKRAVDAGAFHIHYSFAVSEQFNLANANKTVGDAVLELGRVREQFSHLQWSVSLSTAFGCPFTGAVPLRKVRLLVQEITAMGISRIGLADTVGIANPVLVKNLLEEIQDLVDAEDVSLHFHNTYGMGLANVLQALQLGYRHFDASACGLGGCPFAPGAAGNIATEDLVFMVREMGMQSRIDLAELLRTVHWIKSDIHSCGSSHLAGIKKSKVLEEICEGGRDFYAKRIPI